MGRIVNTVEFAELVGYARRTVQRWIAEGMPAARSGKKGDDLRIDTATAIAWLVNREAEKRGGQAAAPGSQAEETLGLTRAKRIAQELANAEKKGSLASLEAMSQAANAAMVIVGAQLDGLAGRLAVPLAGMTEPAEIRELLFDECRRLRSAAADRLEDYFTLARSGEPPSPPAETDPLAVGGDPPRAP